MTASLGVVLDRLSNKANRLIALMLGRMKLDVQTCMKVYLDLSEEIFQESWRVLGQKGKKFDVIIGKPWFDAKILERAIKKVAQTHLGSAEALMIDPKDDTPDSKVYVKYVVGPSIVR